MHRNNTVSKVSWCLLIPSQYVHFFTGAHVCQCRITLQLAARLERMSPLELPMEHLRNITNQKNTGRYWELNCQEAKNVQWLEWLGDLIHPWSIGQIDTTFCPTYWIWSSIHSWHQELPYDQIQPPLCEDTRCWQQWRPSIPTLVHKNVPGLAPMTRQDSFGDQKMSFSEHHQISHILDHRSAIHRESWNIVVIYLNQIPTLVGKTQLVFVNTCIKAMVNPSKLAPSLGHA